MKRILSLLFLLPVFAKAQQPSAEALVKEFISIIKTGEKARFHKLFPDKVTLNQMYSDMLREGKIPDSDTAEAREAMDDMSDEVNEIYGDVMRRIREKQINPAQLVFKSVAFKADSKDSEMTSDMKLYKGSLYITAGAKTYLFEVEGILEYKGSFYGIDLAKITIPPKTKTPARRH